MAETKKKQKNKNNKKIVAKTKLDVHGKLILNGILIAILFFGAIFMFSIANNIDIENKNVLMSYEDKSDVTYTVSLKSNNFYSTSTLNMNQLYPSAIIDKININYKYDFKTSEQANYSYRYFATATIVINNKDGDDITSNDKLLLTKTYQLLNEINGSEINNDTFNIEKTFSINYSTYNNFVTSYQNTYNIAVDAYLKVTMYVQVEDTYQGNTINVSKAMDVKIPLVSNPIEITINNPDNQTGSIEKETTIVSNNQFFIIFAAIMLIVSILLLIQEITKVIKSDKQQSKYITELNKIISANSEVIVKVKNKINLKDSNIIEVESIDALLDAQNELRIPIAYFEIKRNKEGCFVMVNGKEAWRYIFKIEEDE